MKAYETKNRKMTTISFDRDVATALELLKKEKFISISALVNDLVRKGLK